ncbi:hypothetical protein VTK73DRAFT_10000 [Phialemonium thermophilum]|uniref:General transcription and DNA repair factor IIH n=1 Tax=Phialemonium thermophilum TaxID=223376 RepID=A0ABR3Y481_9PEZI
MADSDGDYVEDLSDDERLGGDIAPAIDSNYATRSKKSKPDRSRQKGERRKGSRTRAAWEDIQRSWEDVVETADGSITVGELLEAEKRRRLLRDTTPLQRGIIRHVMLVLDMSFAMADKDMLPSRYILTLNYSVDFVRDFFEQNPISQLGIIAMRDGIAVRISDLSGNSAEHIERLRQWAAEQEPQGNPSLQNALEMCRGALFHAPSHGTREVLVIYGALLSSDPGDIHETIANLITDRIRVSVVGLSAQVAICAELCARTNGGDDGSYAVALDEQHFRELFLAATTPPITRSVEREAASLLMMGFPSRALAPGDHLSLCACHNQPSREGYACTRCRTKVCRLPAECPSCGLTLILSTHLARSYHHLFPLRNWVEVPWTEADRSVACYSCLTPFPTPSRARLKGKGKQVQSGVSDNTAVAPTLPEVKGISESGRYACPVCGNHFCIDCDVFAHEVVHNCPGCQSDARVGQSVPRDSDDGDGAKDVNGRELANGAMAIDTPVITAS